MKSATIHENSARKEDGERSPSSPNKLHTNPTTLQVLPLLPHGS